MTDPISTHPSRSDSKPAAPSSRTKVKRGAARAEYGTRTVREILEAGMLCHLGVSLGKYPAVIPTVYGLIDDELYLHGSMGNRVHRALLEGAEACLCVTLVDGLVLSRSAFHHSMNYRSVVIYGHVREVDDEAEKLAAFEAIIEHMLPGRYAETREPNRREIERTLVLALPLAEASAKIRRGPPVEEESDYALSHWGGEIPLRIVADAPIADSRSGVPLPQHIDDHISALRE